MSTLKMTDIEKVSLALKPVTAAGNPANVDGAPAWNNSDESVATLTVDEDGLSASVVTTGKLGTTRISVTADADLGEGMEEIGGNLDIEVGPSKAASLTIEAGVPEPRE